MGNLHLECKYNYCIYWVSSIWVLISDLILSNWRTWCKVNSLQTLEHRSFVVFLKKQIFFCRLPTTFFWLTSSPLIKDLRQFSICFYNQKGGKKHTISLYFFLNFRGISWMTHTHTQTHSHTALIWSLAERKMSVKNEILHQFQSLKLQEKKEDIDLNNLPCYWKDPCC